MLTSFPKCALKKRKKKKPFGKTITVIVVGRRRQRVLCVHYRKRGKLLTDPPTFITLFARACGNYDSWIMSREHAC